MKFSQLKLSNPDVYTALIIFIGGAIALLIFMPGNNPDATRLLAAMFFAFPVLVFGPGLLTKITIDEAGVSAKGPFKKEEHYSWEQVRSARVYVQKLFDWSQVPPDRLNAPSMWTKKCVFVSTERNFWPARRANSTALKFHYRKAAYELLVHYMNQHEARSEPVN